MCTLVVVPQDLKPGNLAVNQDCELKVLNYGAYQLSSKLEFHLFYIYTYFI